MARLPGLLTVAAATVQKFVDRATRLYEQGADVFRIGEYARRWMKWVRSGVRSVLGGKPVWLLGSTGRESYTHAHA